MSITYRRNLTGPHGLARQEYAATNPPTLRCRNCDFVYAVPGTHRVEQSGLVVPALRCQAPGCPMYEYVRLDDWGLR